MFLAFNNGLAATADHIRLILPVETLSKYLIYR